MGETTQGLDRRRDRQSQPSDGDAGSFHDFLVALLRDPEMPRTGRDIGQRLGAYCLEARLGAGGMGVVYRARHVETGQAVALKTVLLPREALLLGIRREIHGLARLRHPGIVRIVDEGEQDGLPWYAMELVEGTTLGHHCARQAAEQAGSEGQAAETHSTAAPGPKTSAIGWWTETLDAASPAAGPGAEAAASQDRRRRPAAGGAIGVVLDVLRRLCEPLAFLHAEGMVHGDLKPGNVLIRPDGSPVLVDFGLLSRFTAEVSRELLDVSAGRAGTAAYMAPEQVLGELVDARADLYSLGCVMFELLAGRPPFIGRSAAQVLRKQLEEDPRPPSMLADGIPPDLDRLVLRLLAKNPRERIGYASDVAFALESLGARGEGEAGARRPRSYLYRPGLAGRQAALESLERFLAGLDRGPGQLVLVAGESGVGKTRLLLELARRARGLGATVLAGECLPSAAAGAGPGQALQALRRPLQAIADRCRDAGAPEAERILGGRGHVLAPYEPGLRGLAPCRESQVRDDLPVEVAREGVFRALLETLAALAGARRAASGEPRAATGAEIPAALLLLLDDLQWADELTLGWLEFLRHAGTGAEGAAGFLVVGSLRSEDVEAQRAAPLRRLLEDPGVPKVRLERLEESEVCSMVGEMLALDPAPQAFAGFLNRQSEGNPFFVAEYLHAAVEAGLLYRDGQGLWQVQGRQDELPLPRSLQQLLGQRLAGLSAEALRLVESAAVLGRELPSVLVFGMAGLGAGTRLEAAEELMRRQVLEDRGTGQLRFVHDKIRELARARIPEDRRPALHRAAAEGLEAHFAADLGPYLGELGSHWDQAGEAAKAAAAYLGAARQARDQYAHDEAARSYAAYLRLVGPPTSESVRVRNEFGLKVLNRSGRCPEALEQHRAAVVEARALGDREGEARSLLASGLVHDDTGAKRRAARLYQEALGIARDIGDENTQRLGLALLATLADEQGHSEQACALGLQALELARRRGDREGEGTCLLNLAEYSQHLDRLGDALRLVAEAQAASRDAGDVVGQALAMDTAADVEHALGRPVEARAHYEEALASLRQVGERRQTGISLTALARLVRQAEGRLEQAEAHCLEAERLLRGYGDLLYLGLCLCQRGHVELAQSRSPRASLQEAKRLAVLLHAAPRSELGKSIARLRRAQEAAGKGAALFRGETPEDLPAGLRHWLEGRGQLVKAPSDLLV